MAAVGLSGVFKYGGKFLGYVVAVVLAAGVFVGGGAYFAVTGGVDLGNPSLGSLTTARAIIGAVLVLVGSVISLSGLFGLTHKLLADAAAVAAAPTAAAGTPAEEAAEADDDATKTADDAASTDTGDGADQPVEGDAPSETEQPATDQSVQAQAGTDGPPAAEPGSGSAVATSDSEPRRSDDYVDESASEDDWTESKYATGTRADDVAAAQSAAPPAGQGAEAGADGQVTAATEDDQTEWTPPDPAEFEQSSEPVEAEQEDVEPVHAEPATDEPPVDGAGGQSDDEVRTWDDVRNASSGNGIEAENAQTDVDQPSPVQDGPTGADDLVGGDDVTRDPVTQDEPVFADEQSGGGSGLEDAPPEADDAPVSNDPVADDPVADDPVEDDDPVADDDATLADEGVTSFEVEGDDDPLGDRLSGGD